MSPEELLTTTDRDSAGNTVTFNMIEDESGDLFWTYGHGEPSEFAAEVNRWLTHLGMDGGGLLAPDSKVEHLWARMSKTDEERFDLYEPTGSESDAHMFPVSRLIF